MRETETSADSQTRRLMLGAGLGALGAAALAGSANAQNGQRILDGLLGNRNQTGTTALSSSDADSGLREALVNGAVAAALRLGRADGYWGDNTVRIPLPGTLGSLQRRLQPLRMSGALDDLQLKVNRGAETAAPMAVDIFRNVIRGLDLGDVYSVLRGSPTAATDLLNTRSRPQLLTLFTPPVRSGLDSSGAGIAFEGIERRYGRQIGTASAIFGNGASTSGGSLRDQFTSYAVNKALDGLFTYVGNEERAIRQDPAKRTTDILRRAFGSR